MISSKVIDLIKTFNEAEFSSFGLFVSSPYFNKEKVQVRFYDILKKHYPLFNGKNFEKEPVYSKLYPGKKYNDGVMRNILSTTLLLAENFLAIYRFSRDNIQYRYNIAVELNSRRQGKLYEKELSAIDNSLQNENIKDSEFYYKLFLLADDKRRFGIRQKSLFAVDENVLQDISHNLSVSFMISMLRIHTYITNTNRYMFHYEKNKYIMEGIENHILGNFGIYKNISILVFYFNFYMLTKTGEEKYYFELSNLYKTTFNSLSNVDKRNTNTVLANYCYTKINKGELTFLKEQYNIYRQNLDTGYYKGEKGFMSHIFFINVVVTGLEAGDGGWISGFIEKYNHELDSINRENTVIFCSAFYSYWNKDYSQALKLAAMVKTDDTSYKHQLKSLYLKIYFELNEIEAFYSHIDSYKHFIANDKNTGEQVRINVGNYINYSKKLFDLKISNANADYESGMIKNEIINNKAMINKPWLLRKLEEIEQSI